VTSFDTLGPDAAQWDLLWGGPGGGSWARTKLPDNRALLADDDPVYVQSLQDLLNNVYGKINNYGMTGTYDAYPYINTDNFTAKFAIVPNGQPYVPVFFSSSAKGTGNNAQNTWAQAARAMAEGNYSTAPVGGIPIPPGLEPTLLADGVTPDSDGTLEILQLDWTWPGRAGSYPWRYFALFGAISPSQNLGIGREERWTTKYAGRISGARTDTRAHGFNSPVTGDYGSTTNPRYTAPAVAGTVPAGYAGKTYVGWGQEGLVTQYNSMPTATHLPLSHSLITKRDLARTDPVTGVQGYIDHPIGFMLYAAPAAWATAPHSVWPAQGYDSSSRYFHPHGTMWRLPYDWVVDPALAWQEQMLQKAMRDYGIIFYDTTGATGLSFRAEAGSRTLWSFGSVGGGANALMKRLPYASLKRLVPGSDTLQNPTSGDPPPIDTGPSIRASYGRVRGMPVP
jgi:hypothetical protein